MLINDVIQELTELKRVYGEQMRVTIDGSEIEEVGVGRDGRYQQVNLQSSEPPWEDD